MSDASERRDLAELFGIYRAEWLKDAIFRLFSQPSYFPELETDRPCLLEGGRGTGKTTVLQCLSFEGRLARDGNDPTRAGEWPYYGFYYKADTNSVRAFQGDELPERQWQKLFAHYLNLVLCGRVADFLEWFGKAVPSGVSLPPELCANTAESLFCQPATTAEELSASIQQGLRRFEGWVNNIDPTNLPPMSMQGVALEHLCNAVLNLPRFKGKRLFFIIDEFENLRDDQQAVVNTLVKHCGPGYTFKIGVREQGWRRRHTLNPDEQLQSPADYERINIEERLDGDQFASFAAEVCRLRIAERYPESLYLETMLPALSVEDEAVLLGVNQVAKAAREAIARSDPDLLTPLEDVSSLEVALIAYWARAKRISIARVVQERAEQPETWQNRLHNYRVPLLFTLRGSVPGVRKYYAGWRTFTLLAGNNIRYLLQLVGEALRLQRLDGQPADGEPIDPLVQTRAAISVGQKNIKDLEGLGVHGAQLTRLVLSLGRLFEMLAQSPQGRRPEVTRFTLPPNEPADEIEPLLRAAVMHLALVRRVSSQRTDLDLKSYDYAVHPIFAAFFGFSHRDMRKMELSPNQILRLMQDPKRTIREIARLETDADAPLPDQLRLFESFYGDR
ncbi:hypothetical protein [Sphingomonas phyllosphaerae]|uniref:ORC-CDC6 family AAA ATPase n=1 Tax=Sphingomonas phyllosphaerae TaxID=257003 RepID=UPI0003B67BC3|nr:hypothetical protein [Sphingomonas phyllosphaerae]